jgi:hypothetical protein
MGIKRKKNQENLINQKKFKGERGGKFCGTCPNELKFCTCGNEKVNKDIDK